MVSGGKRTNDGAPRGTEYRHPEEKSLFDATTEGFCQAHLNVPVWAAGVTVISALIERTIRQAMANTGLSELLLYPKDRGCAAPTTARILEIFTGVARHQLTAPDGTVLRTFQPELTDLQRQVLDLLDIPTSVYSPSP